jgi:hypothetical protein
MEKKIKIGKYELTQEEMREVLMLYPRPSREGMTPEEEDKYLEAYLDAQKEQDEEALKKYREYLQIREDMSNGTGIEPMEFQVNWTMLKRTLSEKTYDQIFNEWMNTDVPYYRMMIIHRWCRHLELMGYSQESLNVTATELLTAAQIQENVEFKVFSTPIAKQMREAGSTDLEILKAAEINLYQGYIEILRTMKMGKDRIYPYSRQLLEEKVFIM